MLCRSPHGERGLKSNGGRRDPIEASRSPHGERGLKFELSGDSSTNRYGRSPHGERGLKYKNQDDLRRISISRSPHGERGLKSLRLLADVRRHTVALLTESVD